MRARTPGVHHALWNALMVKVGNLLAKYEILQQRGAARSGFQGVVVVGNLQSLISRQGMGRCLGKRFQLLLLGLGAV